MFEIDYWVIQKFNFQESIMVFSEIDRFRRVINTSAIMFTGKWQILDINLFSSDFQFFFFGILLVQLNGWWAFYWKLGFASLRSGELIFYLKLFSVHYFL